MHEGRLSPSPESPPTANGDFPEADKDKEIDGGR
jgi:hypothetical protein